MGVAVVAGVLVSEGGDAVRRASPRPVQEVNRAVMGEWSEPVVVLVTLGSSPSERRSGPVAMPLPDWTLRIGLRRAWEMRMWSMSSRRPR